MYNNSPRDCPLPYSATTPCIGPATYHFVHPYDNILKSSVPFLTSAVRKTVVPVAATDVLYSPPALRSKIKYGNSLRFTAVRETMQIREGPGPTEYEPKHVGRKCMRSKREVPNKGRLYVCRMPYNIEISTPSVPHKIDENGYDIDEDNHIVKMPPTDHDRTLGPAFYNVPFGEVNYNSLKYSGCAWSKYTGQRSKLGASDTPAPTDYDPNFCLCRTNPEYLKVREMNRRKQRHRTYTADMICQTIRANMPGPGYYDTVEEKKKAVSASKAFICSGKRFVYDTNDIPGPLHYYPCDCFKRQYHFSVKRAPFTNGAPRFKHKIEKPSPGPGYYEIEDGPKRCGCLGVRVPFNSKAERKWTFQGDGTDEPDFHDVPPPKQDSRKTFVFKNTIPRFTRKKRQYCAEVASYIITDAFNYVHDQKSHFAGRRSFNSSEPKFAKIYDFAGFVKGEGNPGPGEYEVYKCRKCTSGPYFNTSPRFKEKTDDHPGPGQYTLHPSVGESLYKTKITHNARIMKEVIKKMKFEAPKEPKPEPTNERDSLDDSLSKFKIK